MCVAFAFVWCECVREGERERERERVLGGGRKLGEGARRGEEGEGQHGSKGVPHLVVKTALHPPRVAAICDKHTHESNVRRVHFFL